MTKVIFKSISLIGVFLIALAKCPGEMPPRNHDLEEPMPDMPRRRGNIIHRVFYDNSTKLPTIDELPQAVTLKQLMQGLLS